MGKEEDRIKKTLILNEEQLLENKARGDAKKIAELIGENCIEFTAPGKQRVYKPGDLFESVDGVSYIDSNTIQLIDLCADCKLLLYVTAKVNNNSRVKTNNSSIWKKIDGAWKIMFHQGTDCTGDAKQHSAKSFKA